MDILTLYLITRLDAIQGSMVMLGMLFCIMALINGLIYGGPDVDDEECSKKIKRYLSIVIAIILLFTFIPSTKDAFTIIGGHYATNIEGTEKLSPNMVKAANKFIEDYLEEGTTGEE